MNTQRPVRQIRFINIGLCIQQRQVSSCHQRNVLRVDRSFCLNPEHATNVGHVVHATNVGHVVHVLYILWCCMCNTCLHRSVRPRYDMQCRTFFSSNYAYVWYIAWCISCTLFSGSLPILATIPGTNLDRFTIMLQSKPAISHHSTLTKVPTLL